MRIQHNIPAMSSYRNYTRNVSAVNKNLEKLSSGYRINRAGDDAAGLAISEKMRLQISGLEQAQSNAKSGINLVQTAEGALTEVHDMLNRMYTLAEQSANGTYSDEVDREQLQKEVNSLRTEINRIADATNYNGIKLLNGDLDGSVKVANETNAIASTDNIVSDGQLGKKEQAGVFSIDLTDAVLTNNDTNPVAAEKFTFELFGKTVKLNSEAIAVGASYDGEALAKLVAEKWNGDAAANTFADYGVKITAEANGAKVTFSMDKAPTTEWKEAALSASAKTGFDGLGGSNQGDQFQVTVEQEPVDKSMGRIYGKAKITLDNSIVGDGKTLKIGDQTYVFAVGKNSAYKDADNVIDLTDCETVDEAALKKAANRLSEAAKDNKYFKVGTDVKDEKAVTFTEKEGAIDYSVNNLSGANGKGGVGTTAKDSTVDDWKGLIMTGEVDKSSKAKALALQIGDTADSYNKMNVSIKDMHAAAMGIGSIDISTQEGASEAMKAIQNATNYVSDVRGDLGALQNRLDHTINNLSVTQENIQDAESTIRDVDIAKEMMAYTKNNILVQSAQAMLAQANQLPQGVLQLLG